MRLSVLSVSEIPIKHYTLYIITGFIYVIALTCLAFEDVHVMVFVGYGFLMIFLKRYGFSGLGYNFIVGTVAIQWSVVMEGFFDLEDSKIKLTGDRWVYRKRFLHEGLKRGGGLKLTHDCSE